jgi:hypothetical protein
MPNVAGREFPYTPQGMAAAEQYKQSLGMRGGGMMGFRPVGYQDGDLVEAPINAPSLYQGGIDSSEFLMDTAGGAIPPLVATGMGRTMATRMAEGAPGGGDGGLSKAVDVVSSLVQEFTADVQAIQDVPDLVRKVTNTALGMHGIPVDLVNAILKSLGVPVSDTPIGGSRNLMETFGFPGEQEAVTRSFSIDPLVSAGAGARFAEDRAIEAMNVERRRSPDAPVFNYIRDPEKDYERPDPSLIPLREPGTGLPQSIPSGMRHGGIMSLRRR